MWKSRANEVPDTPRSCITSDVNSTATPVSMYGDSWMVDGEYCVPPMVIVAEAESRS